MVDRAKYGRELVLEFENIETDKSWKEFQIEKLNYLQKDKVESIEKSIKMNFVKIELVKEKIKDVTKYLNKDLGNLKNENCKLRNEFDKIIYPNCMSCGEACNKLYCDYYCT